MTPEGKIVAYLKRVVREQGGIVRKVEWSGVRGAPDLLVMYRGGHVFVECKAPGQKPEPHQIREHERMERVGGGLVVVIDSEAAANELLSLMDWMHRE